jgi:hypothetical protein
MLRAEGADLGSGAPLNLDYESGLYAATDSGDAPMSSKQLVRAARRGHLVATVTARIGQSSDVDHPQPALWLPAKNPNNRTSLQKIPELSDPPTFTLFGRHVVEGAIILVDGRAVGGTVTCESGGALPACAGELLRVELSDYPTVGDHALQIATPGGMVSNEVLIVLNACPDGVMFDLIQCRTATLLATIRGSDDLGSLRDRVERILERAHEATEKAEQRLADGRRTSARQSLRRAANQLNKVVRRLRSPRAEQTIPENTRTTLSETAIAIRDEAAMLRDSL